MVWKKTKFISLALLALIISMSAFLLPVYASVGYDGYDESDYEDIIAITAINAPMVVHATWLDDEMLRIDVTDIATGAVSSLAIRLSDFVADAGNSPYILIQAADLDGNLSGAIQITNPFYVPKSDDGNTNADCATDQNNASEAESANGNGNGSSYGNGYDGTIVPPSGGLTPDGTGTVVDNVITQNEIEFFTVFTEEGNVFFLVVDRQRNTDNVYLLNAVTEADLMALAERSGNPIENNHESAIPTPPIQEPTPPAENNQDPEPPPEPDTPQASGSGNGNLIFMLVAVAVMGGAAYYFKIVRPKKNAAYDDDDYDESDDESGGDEDSFGFDEDYGADDGSDDR